MKKYFPLLLLFTVSVLMVGCSNRVNLPREYGELCSPIQQRHLMNELQMNQVVVYRKGDQIILLTSLSNLFPAHSEYLLSNAQSTLNAIAAYLACFRKISVRVVVYTKQLTSTSANETLSRLQAQHVVNYLTQKGIDARLIAAVGGGVPETADVQVGTQRVEIYTKKMP